MLRVCAEASVISLGLSLLLAIALRLLGALLRPVWVDEAASAVFSAGNSSWQTPINRLVPLDRFVAALRLDAHAGLGQGLVHLHQEDNHPPLHFALTHLGARLLQADGSVLDPLTARWPAVLLGSLAVPLLHQAVLAAGGSRRAARLAALWMAVSPLAVALGLEARHYALALTGVCGGLWGLAHAWQQLQHRRRLGAGAAVAWVGCNLLGLLTHHLVVVSIAAQLATLTLLSARLPVSKRERLVGLLPPLLALALGGLWLQLAGNGGAVDQTAWLDFDRRQPLQWLVIPLQMLLSALCGLLAPGTSLVQPWQWLVVVPAGLATLIGLIALVVMLRRAGRPPGLLLLFCLSSAAGLLVLCGLTGKDLSRALRYGFLVLPGVLALVAVAADQAWQHGRQRAVAALLGCSLVCSVGVAAGVALPASYNPELFVRTVAVQSSHPIVLAFNERPVRQGHPLIGYEGLSIAWQLQTRSHAALNRGAQAPRLMLLIGDGTTPPAGLQQLDTLAGPFDLWLVNAYDTRSLQLRRRDCRHLSYASAGGHLHHHYRCGVEQPNKKEPRRALS